MAVKRVGVGARGGGFCVNPLEMEILWQNIFFQ